MKNEMENAVKVLLKKITDTVQPDEALKFTQAVLNLAHAANVMNSIKPKESN